MYQVASVFAHVIGLCPGLHLPPRVTRGSTALGLQPATATRHVNEVPRAKKFPLRRPTRGSEQHSPSFTISPTASFPYRTVYS